MKNNNKNFKTTKKDFDYFIREVCYWTPKLNLQDYGAVFVHISLEEKASLAWVDVSLENKTATFGLAEDWSWMHPDKYQLAKCAFHECCELVLYKLYDKLIVFYSQEYVNELRHEVIRILESVLFEPYWNSKKRR